MAESELFASAWEKAAPEERAAFLAEACASDEKLRRRVEGLLGVRDEPHGRPDPHMVDPPPTRVYTPSAEPGQLFAGRYKLREELDKGGMGIVFVADQIAPMQRRVALKIIGAGLLTQQLLARFDQERQALALMDHPNIAKVFDAGLDESGQPFFAMELVKGLPLTQYCDDAKLSPRERLELFVPICQAVQHAHQKGVIHRDLKPSNILVGLYDGRPVPKVIDFGVAKATGPRLTEKSIYTEIGSLIGTLEYMSPEQAELNNLDIDTRTDVYALGVILYELLTGAVPFSRKELEKAGLAEMLRQIKEVEPPKPSTKLSGSETLPSIAAHRQMEPKKLTALVRGELDWIVMKALEKERSRRYETANGLARDIQRYLADEIVEARPPSAGYRLKKLMRRHKGKVIAASLVLFALLAGVAGTTWGLVEARRQKTQAGQNFRTARTLALDLGYQINRLETGQMNPNQFDQARKDALDKAREQFDQFRAELPDDVAVQLQTASLHRYAANVSRLLADYPAAMAAYAAAEQIYEDLIARFPNEPDYKVELAQTLSDRSATEKRLGRLKDSGATIERALELVKGLQGKIPDAHYHRTIGLIATAQTDVAYLSGRFDIAAQSAAQVVEHFDNLMSVPAGERKIVDPLFAVIGLYRLATAQRELGDTDAAVKTHDEALARVKTWPKENRDERFWDSEVRRERARTAATIPAQREASAEDLIGVIREMEKLANENKAIAFYLEGVAAAYLDRGEILLSSGKLDHAVEALEKSLAKSRELIERHGQLSASLLVRGRTYVALGRAQEAKGNKEAAKSHCTKAVTVFDIALKDDPENMHHRRGRAEAERALRPNVK